MLSGIHSDIANRKTAPFMAFIAAGFIWTLMVLWSPCKVYAKSLTLNFKTYADLPSSNVIIDPDRYYATQGTAFDTYTGKDAYTIAISKLSSNNVAIVHYVQNDNGIEVVNKVVYPSGQLGHANDATIYKQGNEKYLFVARGGINNKTACMIKLSEYNSGIAKVYKVKFSKLNTKSGTDLRGITYVGKKAVKIGKKKLKKQLFVVEVGRRLNLVYLNSIKNNTASFVTIDNQRIQAPKIGSRECTAQGVTYHNGQLYVAFGDEGKGGKRVTGKIGRVGFTKLFSYANDNQAIAFPYIWTKVSSGEFVPEAVYFTSLEGKSPLYMTTNEADSKDYLYRTTKKY